ncbi:MAG: outer membrane lipoprotein-sorting protein, partial [Myxococcota bacterium]
MTTRPGMVRPMRRILFFALVCLSTSALSGCCASRFDRPPGPTPDSAGLIEKMNQRVKKVSSFEYLTRMSYYGDSGARKGRVELLGEAPDRFRMEALTPSDDTVAILISDGSKFVSHERGQTRCMTGPACATNVSRLLPVSLEGPDLYAVLVGGAPVI